MFIAGLSLATPAGPQNCAHDAVQNILSYSRIGCVFKNLKHFYGFWLRGDIAVPTVCANHSADLAH